MQILKQLAFWFVLLSFAHADQNMLLLRHGEGEQNIADVWDKNAPLTDEGIHQLRKVAHDLMEQGYNKETIGAVFISPVPRVLETAEILADAGLFDRNQIVIEPRITRRDMGAYEGQPVMHWGDNKKDDLPFIREYGVETIDKIRERVGQFYGDLIQSNLPGHCLIITHGSITRELMECHHQDRVRLELGEVRIMSLMKEKTIWH